MQRQRIMCAAPPLSRVRRGGLLFRLTPDRRTRPVPAPLSLTRTSVLALGLLALITGAVVSGCGPGQLPQGPLGTENHSTVGQPVLEGGADTISFDVVYNSGN